VNKKHEAVAGKLGLERTDAGVVLTKESLLVAIGGPLGIAESILPAFAFSIAFGITKQAFVAVSIAAGISIAFIIYRLVRKQSALQASIGALAIGLAAFLALREGGQAEDYFVPGFYTNAAYGGVLLISILVRYPIMGFAAQFLFGIEKWRENRIVYRRARTVTLVWVGFFAARLAVQLPLYFASEVELLAFSRVVMGAPAYAGLLALTWVLLRRISTFEK
jgi:hypothetical protein